MTGIDLHLEEPSLLGVLVLPGLVLPRDARTA